MFADEAVCHPDAGESCGVAIRPLGPSYSSAQHYFLSIFDGVRHQCSGGQPLLFPPAAGRGRRQKFHGALPGTARGHDQLPHRVCGCLLARQGKAPAKAHRPGAKRRWADLEPQRALRLMRSALDTNVLVYAEGFGDQGRIEKSRSLLATLANADVVIPLQCLGELFRVLTGKAGRSPAEARDAVLGWMDSFPVVDSTPTALAGGMDLCVDHKLGSWDALVLSVAADAGARLLLTEDLNPGFTWRGVRVVNPYAPNLDPLLLQLKGEQG